MSAPDVPVLPSSHGMKLAQVLGCLAKNPDVLGVAEVGSGLGAAAGSDIDLMLMLNGPSPRLWITSSYIDTTAADIIITTKATVVAFVEGLETLPIPIADWLRSLLGNPRIHKDADGLLLRASEQANSAQPRAVTTALWHALNVQAISICRLVLSPREVHARELVVTLPGAYELLWQTYFELRGLGGVDLKSQISWLDGNDPGFWTGYLEGQTGTRDVAAHQWLELASLAAAPKGGLWPAGSVIEPRGDTSWIDAEPPGLGQLLTRA